MLSYVLRTNCLSSKRVEEEMSALLVWWMEWRKESTVGEGCRSADMQIINPSLKSLFFFFFGFPGDCTSPLNTDRPGSPM